MKIFYSGDIRFHGVSKDKAFEEIEKGIDTIFDIILSYYSIKRN